MKQKGRVKLWWMEEWSTASKPVPPNKHKHNIKLRWRVYMCVCVCVCVRARVCVCVHACVGVCVHIFHKLWKSSTFSLAELVPPSEPRASSTVKTRCCETSIFSRGEESISKWGGAALRSFADVRRRPPPPHPAGGIRGFGRQTKPHCRQPQRPITPRRAGVTGGGRLRLRPQLGTETRWRCPPPRYLRLTRHKRLL